MMRNLIFIFTFLFFGFASAGVYRCIDENGVVEFRDRACELASESAEFLPYVYEPTDPDRVVEKIEALEKTENKTAKRLAAEQKKKDKLEARLKKAAEKEAAKKERRLMRCENTKQKIKEIEVELRGGCKLRRCNTLKKQLAHCQKMQKKYCTSP